MSQILRTTPLLIVLSLSFASGAPAMQEKEHGDESTQESQSPPQPVRRIPDEEVPPVSPIHGKTGLIFQTEDGTYSTHLWFRAQFRYSYPFDLAPTTREGFLEPAQSTFTVRRARLKIKGNAYRRWLRYYFEYDFVGTRILDLRFTIAKFEWMALRVGQFKVLYNRERLDSSGRQQFIERSIVTRPFTVDRQPGITVGGHLFKERVADAWYFFGVFNGNGRGATNDDASMMWVARYQWHFLKRPLPYTQGDIEFHEQPAGTLSFGAVRNKSPFTRFSSSGGGQLERFESGETEQYSLRQFLEEFAFKYRGFSVQQEFHWKEIEDNKNDTTTELRGVYAQAGYFLNGLVSTVPKPLEVAIRYAWVNPNVVIDGNDSTELTIAANWFFDGHDNKLTFDYGHLTFEDTLGWLSEHRFRAQWDISF